MWTCRIQHKSLQKLVFLTWPHPVAPGMPPLEVRVPAPQTQPGCLLKTPPLSDGNTLGWRKMQGSETNSSLAWNSGHSQGRERPAGPRWGLQAAPPSISKGADWGPPALAEEGSNTFQEPSLLPISFFFSFFFLRAELSSPFVEEEEKAFPRCFEFQSPDPRLLVSVSLGSSLLIALFDIGYVVVKCLH